MKTNKFPVNTIGIGDMDSIQKSENLMVAGFVTACVGLTMAMVGFMKYYKNTAWIGSSEWETTPDNFKEAVSNGHKAFKDLHDILHNGPQEGGEQDA